MNLKMETNRTESVPVYEMRETLRNFLKMEKWTSLKYPKYPFTFAEDMDYLSKKVAELKLLIDDFNNSDSRSSFPKISSKLVHIFNRVQRSVSTDDDEHSTRSKVFEVILN